LIDRLPFAPPHQPGEPPTAYASRIAAAHGLLANELCSDNGMPYWQLVNGTDAAIDVIAALGGVDRADLAACAFVRTGNHDFSHRGQQLRRESLVVGRLDVCPRCLLDDAQRAGRLAPEAAYFCRAEWLVDAVDTCRIHRSAMVTVRKAPGTAYDFDFSSVLASEAGRLGDLAGKAVLREPTALQEYVLARFEGRATEIPFLDAMSLFAAIRTCEMLGTAACFGRKAKRDTLDADRLRAARIRGFEIGSRGKEGIEELLKAMTTAHARRRTTVADQVVRQAFSTLHNYLHLNPKRPVWKGAAFASLRAVLSDFIKASFPLKPGDNVLGEIITVRKLHSVTSLAKGIGCGAERVKKVLLLAGLIGEDQAGLPNPNIVFDAVKGEQVMRESVAGLPYHGAASYIGTGRYQVRMFVEARFIEPIADGTLGLRATFAPAVLDAFVAGLLNGARAVKGKGAHHATMQEAARKAMCSQADLAKLILGGRLKWVGTLGRKRDYRSILVDLREVRSLVHGLDSTTISVPEFAERLGFKKQTAHSLVKHGHVKSVSTMCAGHRVARITLSEVDAFRRRYVSLGELARVRGQRPQTVKAALDARAVRPAFDPSKVFTHFYRRADVRGPGLDRDHAGH
jgi:TniQ